MRELLEQVNTSLGLDAEVEVTEEDGQIRGVLHGDDLGLFIGRHGQTIDAVQHLAFKVAAQGKRLRRASKSTLPATGIAVARRSNARPSRRRPTPCARAVRPRSTR